MEYEVIDYYRRLPCHDSLAELPSTLITEDGTASLITEDGTAPLVQES